MEKRLKLPLKIKVGLTAVLNGLITVCRTIQDSILKTFPRRFRPGMTDDRVCCENIAAAMFVTVKEMRAGPS